MKKLILALGLVACVMCGYAEPMTGDEILAFVRTKLPDDPLKLTGTLKVKARNGFTRTSMPVVMELDWGAETPTAIYTIGEAGSKAHQSLSITWKNDLPCYIFSDPANQPTSDILGTGITWADLSFSVFWWPGAKLIEEGKKINRDCYIVDVPVPESKNTMRLWIEKNMGMLLEAQTLDAKGKEINCLNIISIKKMDGMWVAKDLRIEDRKTGSKTLLQISDLEWKNGPPRETVLKPESAAAFDPAKSVNEFTFDLYRELADGHEGNLFFSPYSISTALAMTYAGAGGETAEQMNAVLHFGGPDATHPAFCYLRNTLDSIQKEGSVQLSVANALWPQKGFEFLPDYLKLIETSYAGEIHSADFIADPEASRKGINQWVEFKTENRIQDLIGEGAINSDTRLVLVNAIYFKGNWASRFKEGATRPAPFKRSDGTTIDVPMMSQTGDFRLARSDTFQAIELPYDGGQLSMIILLPNAGEKPEPVSLDDLEFHEMEVGVQLPRFNLESSFGLADTLASMGMPLAFSRKADFSGMDGSRDLNISAVLHKAFVEVNEEGTEAAAATGVVMGRMSLPPQFTANHPFLFFIRENSSGAILFIGRVMDPSK